MTFRFEVTAPATAGQYASQWGMQREGYGSFGGSSVPVTVNVTEPVNNAQPMGQSAPAQMETGKSYTVAVAMYNNGETTWTRAQNYTLMSQSPHNNTTWGFNRVPLPVDNIAPGQSTTFTFNVTAPSAPGSYPIQWGMQSEGYGSFGPGTNVAMINVVAPPPLVNNAEVVGISVPARMQTQLNYNVAVTMRSNGTTTWMPGVYNLGSRNPTDNLIWGPGSVALATAVGPGQQYTFNFPVTAPAAGDYVKQWGMLSQVEWFGALASSPVTVSEDLTGVTFIHTDGLGSPVARTDGAGTVLSRTRYEPYGYVAAGATPTIGFTGHVNDADTGLTYMQQRYYDPVAGRFLSVDPVTTDANTGGSFNRYSYARNSPYTYIDPDGRQERAAQNLSDATVKSNGWAGFKPKQSAQGIYEKAFQAARDSKLPGIHNGPQDAARHCMGLAEATRQYGGLVALVLGEVNEKKADLTHNQTSEEKSMDRHNNWEGVKIGSGAESFEQIREQCLAAVETGKTVSSLPPNDQQHPYREPAGETK